MRVTNVALTVLFFLFLSGCRKEAVQAPIVPEPILDELVFDSGASPETVYVARRVVEHDTITYIRVDTLHKKIYVKVKPDTIRITVIDKKLRDELADKAKIIYALYQKISDLQREQPTLMTNLGYMAIGMIVMFVIVLLRKVL